MAWDGAVESRHDSFEGVSSAGLITTGVDRGRIPVDFEPVIAEAIEQVEAAGEQVSLYVYGSVATGRARVGVSDVDFVTIGMPAVEAKRMATRLSANYAAICRSVDIGPAQWADYEKPGDEAYGNRVFLRHYCVHLTGPNPADSLPDCPADVAAARGFNGDIGACAARWRVELVTEPHVPTLARRIARKTLLAMAGLVSIHDSTWTTDRVASARRWAVVKPELADAIAPLLAWSQAIESGASPSEVRRSLDGVVADVVDEFRQRIGLWETSQ